MIVVELSHRLIRILARICSVVAVAVMIEMIRRDLFQVELLF